jgi:hypothetical protein
LGSGFAGALALEDDRTLGDGFSRVAEDRDCLSRVAALWDSADEDETRDSAAIDEIDKTSPNSKTLFIARKIINPNTLFKG